MTSQAQLLRAHVELTKAIRASEDWEQSYKASPKTLKRLVAEEAALQASANEYLLGLHSRIPALVNWSEVKLKPIMASAVPPLNGDDFAAERARLSQAIYDHLLELIVIGGQAGEDIYSIPIGLNNLSEYVIDVAGRYTGELVSGITETTRSGIQKAIQQSIDLGEDLDAAIERVRKHVANPVRAEMIAQTESVNAYQIGLDSFGEESGAISSTWDSLSGACKHLCAPADGQTVPLGHDFVLGNGKRVKRPAAHVRCRCGRILNYPK